MVKVGIVGGTGYTGVELLRMLVNHPEAEVVVITSRAEEGLRVDALYPSLRGHLNIRFSHPNLDVLAQCDVVFFATPHNVAMKLMPQLLELGTRVVDLSADFRIRDHKLWSKWYGEPHACPELLSRAVYGLPEVNRAAIRDAQLVACPGCYPTSVQLGLLPLLENNLVDEQRLIANATSGVSGAGRQAKIDNLFAEVSDSFKAYGIPGHRHLPEIEQGLGDIAGREVSVTFAPHLVPMVRGMHSTLYAQRFEDEPFVDVLPAGSHPQTRSVRGANHCRLAIQRPQGRDTLVVLSVIDNLVKGQAGSAMQNMNVMFDLPETMGLDRVGAYP